MSQRNSGYVRRALDDYQTPEWVTEALLPHLPPRQYILEPAAGQGQMVAVLARAGHLVAAADIMEGRDFLLLGETSAHGIITNPPYSQAQQFIEHALDLTNRWVAMLLRTDYDHAATRQHLFGRCRYFSKKVVLTRRIVWFVRPGAAPSYNHAWYLWDKRHRGAPRLVYGP